MYTVLATILALAGASAAAPTARSSEVYFFATGNGTNVNHWALINAHVAAGTNSLQIQRPSVYSSDAAHLTSSEDGKSQLIFDLPGVTGAPYEAVLPDVVEGQIGQVLTKPGDGSAAFSIKDNKLAVDVEGSSFLACPVVENGVEVFTLWYGIDVEPAGKTADCLTIDLVTN